MQNRTASPGRGRAGNQTPPVVVASRQGSQDRSRPGSRSASQTRASGTDTRKPEGLTFTLVSPVGQVKKTEKQKRVFPVAAMEVWAAEAGSPAAPVYIGRDRSARRLNADVAFKLLREFSPLGPLSAETNIDLSGLNGSYFFQNYTNKSWAAHAWTIWPKGISKTHFDHVVALNKFVGAAAKDPRQLSEDQSKSTYIRVVDQERFINGYNKEFYRAVEVRDHYGAFDWMHFHKLGPASRKRLDVSIFYQDFPAIRNFDNAQATTFLQEQVNRSVIKVYRKTATNSGPGFVYILHWDEAAAPASAGSSGELRLPHRRPTDPVPPTPKRQNQGLSPLRRVTTPVIRAVRSSSVPPAIRNGSPGLHQPLQPRSSSVPAGYRR